MIYLANIRLPTEKAHGVQIMKMCEAFARAGEQVILVVPKRHTAITEDPFTYYGVEKCFEVKYLPVIDSVSWGRAGFLVEATSFAFAAARAFVRTSDMIYGRDDLVLALLYLCGVRRMVWESHTGAWSFAARFIAHRVEALIVISQGLKDFYVAHGVTAEKIFVAHDGVDLHAFAHPESKEQARRRLGLPLDKKIALYIGRLDGWKGVETLCEAAQLLSDDTRIAVIGGEPEQVKTFQKKYPKVMFLGYQPYRALPDNQAAADALVLPNTGEDIISARFTSPLKLFAYMASGVPIVASDLPSIREVLDESCAYLAGPDNPEAFAKGIIDALEPSGRNRAAAAHERVSQYDWQVRAKHILASISLRDTR